MSCLLCTVFIEKCGQVDLICNVVCFLNRQYWNTCVICAHCNCSLWCYCFKRKLQTFAFTKLKWSHCTFLLLVLWIVINKRGTIKCHVIIWNVFLCRDLMWKCNFEIRWLWPTLNTVIWIIWWFGFCMHDAVTSVAYAGFSGMIIAPFHCSKLVEFFMQ